MKLATQLCPSDIGGNRFIESFAIGGSRTEPYKNVATGSYKGVAGRYAYSYTSSGAISTELFWDYASYVELLAPEPSSRGMLTVAGVGGISTVGIAEVSDGTSHTLAIGEYATDDAGAGAISRAMWAGAGGTCRSLSVP
jgi:hypothetical protein